MQHMKFESPDMMQGNIEKIEALFPNCVTETRGEDGKLKKAVNFDLLRQMLSGDVAEGDEAYEFTWVGKKAAIVEANKPIRKTLRPCPEESVNWDTTENLYIEGDNLEVLKLLQESYLGKVKLIYIDPPYNTGNDFIYRDDFAIKSDEYEEQLGVFDEETGDRLFKNTDSNGRFHSDWCSMMYSRISLARNLLNESGVIIISCDDNEIYNLKKICDEIFGGQNYSGTFIINASPSAIDYGNIANMHEYALMYAKNITNTVIYQLPEPDKEFKYHDKKGDFNIYPLYNGNVAFNPVTRPNLFYPFYLNPNNEIEPGFYEISLKPSPGWVQVYPVISRKDGIQRVWRWGKEKAQNGLNDEIIGYKSESGDWRIVQKSRLTEKSIRSLLLENDVSSRRGTAEVESLLGRKVFPFPKPIELIRKFCAISTTENDTVLDFFSGSATTAHAVMKLNSETSGRRKFIMVQYPEKCDVKTEAFQAGYKTICDIGKERIRRAGNILKEEFPLATQNLDIGFRVLKLADSNMNNVYYSAREYGQQMLDDMESKIKPDRTDLDLLFGCLLEWGLPLSLPYKSETIDGCTIHTYAPGDPDLEIRDALIACFDEKVPSNVIETIARRNPLRAVFREECFTSSPDKINVYETFKRLAQGTAVKVI